MSDECTLRAAETGDEMLLLQLIRELAVYERLQHEVIADESLLSAALFGPEPTAHAIIAEYKDEPAGFALYFFNFSTFLGRPGLYLEDLFVREHLRGHGIGKSLLLYLAGLAHQRGCGRMEWSVLDWNQPAIDFYRSLGAVPMDEWTVFRLDREGLEGLVGG